MATTRDAERCTGCGAELRAGPAPCPLCGAPARNGERVVRPSFRDRDVAQYQAGVRELRERLRRLRDEEAKGA